MGNRAIYDVGIIGGGIVGLATAMALIKAGVTSVTVLEAEGRWPPTRPATTAA